jgi:ATP-binding cassette subfamily B protein
VERESARNAFNRACQYLNYQATAKWTAYVSAVLAGLTYVALLGILWLYADLLVDHGQLPRFHSLPASAQLRYQTLWKGDTDAKPLSSEEEEKRWRQEMAQILIDKVDPDLEERVTDHQDYLDQDNGILSLVVRSYAVQDVFAPVVAWFASWNYWARNDPEHPTFFPSYLIGLLIIAMLLAILGALFLFLMRDSAAQSCIEASNRLRRAVYLHTFRMGTLAFRALGPTEAVTVFTRHVEAVHDALYALMTVYFREMVKFSLLFLFSILVGRWLALAFLLFAILVWFCGGLLSAYLGKQGRTATTQASESLTIMRESLMMMRLVKCYLMEAFNRSRVERQLSHSAEVQSIRYRGEAIYQPLLILIGLLCTLLLLFLAGVIVLGGSLGVPGLIAMTTALVSMYRPLENWLESRRLLRRGVSRATETRHRLRQR